MDDTRGKIPETICKNDLIKKTDQHRAGKTLPGASLFRKRIPLYRSEPARKKRSLETVAPFLEAVQVSHEVITAAERTLFISRDVMEGCDSRLFIQPDRVGIGIPAWCFIHIQHILSLFRFWLAPRAEGVSHRPQLFSRVVLLCISSHLWFLVVQCLLYLQVVKSGGPPSAPSSG